MAFRLRSGGALHSPQAAPDVIFHGVERHRSAHRRRLPAATAQGRLLLTKDKDFLRIDGEWKGAGRSHAGILFLKPKLPIGEAIRRILAYAHNMSAADEADVLRYP